MKTWMRIWAVLAAVALFGAACGNDDDDDADLDPTPPADTAPDDDTDTEAWSLSDSVQVTIAEGKSDYTLEITRGDVQQMLNDDDNGNGNDDERAEIDGTTRWDDGTRRVMLPRDGEDDLEVVLVDDTMYVQVDDLDVGTDDDAEWWQFDLADIDAMPMGLDPEVLIALHDPAAVLQALDAAGDATGGENGEMVDHNGGEAMYWSTTVSLDDIDDRFVEMFADDPGDVEQGGAPVENGGTATDPVDPDAPGQADTEPGDPAEAPGAQPDEDGVDPAEPGNGMNGDDVEVHVWADEDDGEILAIAYGLGDQTGVDATGAQGGFGVLVELDNLGDADDVDVPETDETQTTQLDQLRDLFADVEILDDMNGTGTGAGTGMGTEDGDEDDDNGVFDDDDNDDEDDGLLDDDS